jgi:hypothetical protein
MFRAKRITVALAILIVLGWFSGHATNSTTPKATSGAAAVPSDFIVQVKGVLAEIAKASTRLPLVGDCLDGLLKTMNYQDYWLVGSVLFLVVGWLIHKKLR